MQQMTNVTPFLLRAFYDWILSNDMTPHIVVRADLPGVDVPKDLVQDGVITLNIKPSAVINLELGEEVITFSCRFNQVLTHIAVPCYSLMGVYARENGAGTQFTPATPDEVKAMNIEGLDTGNSSDKSTMSVEQGEAGQESKPTKPSGRMKLVE